ncbi:hypothetical protein BH10BDE1_BH10BDE1_04280 [soil metagenome]
MVRSARLGFGFHSSTKWKAARALSVSLFAMAATCFVILSEPHTLDETLKAHPAWFLSFAVFLLFAVVLGFQLARVATTPFILEFTDAAIVDRSSWRTRSVPYDAIEIFSPIPESIFKVEPSVAELRDKLGLETYLSVSCRLKAGHFSEKAGDFMFFQRVAPTAFEQQGEIVKHLRSKISAFDVLIYDWGDDGDETNA